MASTQPSTSDVERGTFCFKEGVAFLVESSTTTYDLCTDICTNSKCNFTGSTLTFLYTNELERVDGDVRRLINTH